MKTTLSISNFDGVLKELSKEYDIFAPKRFPLRGTLSDTDLIRYDKVSELSEMVFDEKSEFSPKDVLLPPKETMFYFTEDGYKEPRIEIKPRLIFLRSCDLHAVQRVDEIYLRNGAIDPYYKKRRKKVKFAVISCKEGFDACFCVDMETNKAKGYDMAFNLKEDTFEIDVVDKNLKGYFTTPKEKEKFSIDYPRENKISVSIPENIELSDVINLDVWDEYDTRCIACGKCNFVCPTCTCSTNEDLFYSENERCGERRRVWASCEVDDFSNMAGGHDFRKKYGERMRFKTMHKISDFKKRFGYHMCTGCGRCTDSCPEYISFSSCINKLSNALEGK